MTTLDNLVAAVIAAIPTPPPVVVTATIDSVVTDAPRSIMVTYNGSDPVPAKWSGSFDLIFSMSGAAMVGVLVKASLIDGQVFIDDTIVSS